MESECNASCGRQYLALTQTHPHTHICVEKRRIVVTCFFYSQPIVMRTHTRIPYIRAHTFEQSCDVRCVYATLRYLGLDAAFVTMGIQPLRRREGRIENKCLCSNTCRHSIFTSLSCALCRTRLANG